MRRFCILIAALVLVTFPLYAVGGDLAASLEKLRAVGPEAKGNSEAKTAWSEVVAAAKAEDLPVILAALDDANPLAANWIRGAVDAVAERTLNEGGQLPADALEEFVLELKHEPRARRLAFEWLTRVDAGAPDRLIPQFLDDPSVEFRRDAVDRLLAEAGPLFEAMENKKAAAVYHNALSGARDQDQIDLIVERLGKLGESVDLPTHFGFLLDWKIVGPFDNTEKKGYPVAYPPEKERTLNAKKKYEGKAGSVAWFEHATQDPYGKVDLNTAIGKNMGAVAYARTTFMSDRKQTVQIRLACTNANKLWVNGELVMENDVYHAGTRLDQYVTTVKLKKGSNEILLKACQNEDTQLWTQGWEFQLRVCDAAGTAVLAADRAKPTLEAASGGGQ